MTRPTGTAPAAAGEVGSDGDLLAEVGIDAVKWAVAYMRLYGLKLPSEETLIAWFANAISAGECVGYDRGVLAGQGLTPPDLAANDTGWDSRNHPDRKVDYVPNTPAITRPTEARLPAAMVDAGARAMRPVYLAGGSYIEVAETALTAAGVGELLEVLRHADDDVFRALETLDQAADDEPDEPTAVMVRDDAYQLRASWRKIKGVLAKFAPEVSR